MDIGRTAGPHAATAMLASDHRRTPRTDAGIPPSRLPITSVSQTFAGGDFFQTFRVYRYYRAAISFGEFPNI